MPFVYSCHDAAALSESMMRVGISDPYYHESLRAARRQPCLYAASARAVAACRYTRYMRDAAALCAQRHATARMFMARYTREWRARCCHALYTTRRIICRCYRTSIPSRAQLKRRPFFRHVLRGP